MKRETHNYSFPLPLVIIAARFFVFLIMEWKIKRRGSSMKVKKEEELNDQSFFKICIYVAFLLGLCLLFLPPFSRFAFLLHLFFLPLSLSLSLTHFPPPIPFVSSLQFSLFLSFLPFSSSSAFPVSFCLPLSIATLLPFSPPPLFPLHLFQPQRDSRDLDQTKHKTTK